MKKTYKILPTANKSWVAYNLEQAMNFAERIAKTYFRVAVFEDGVKIAAFENGVRKL